MRYLVECRGETQHCDHLPFPHVTSLNHAKRRPERRVRTTIGNLTFVSYAETNLLPTWQNYAFALRIANAIRRNARDRNLFN